MGTVYRGPSMKDVMFDGNKIDRRRLVEKMVLHHHVVPHWSVMHSEKRPSPRPPSSHQ
jgi:hypothetical protein